MTTSPAADRQRRFRQRRARGRSVLRVELPTDLFIGALLDSERLTEGEALQRAKLNAAAADVLVEWARKWKDFRNA